MTQEVQQEKPDVISAGAMTSLDTIAAQRIGIALRFSAVMCLFFFPLPLLGLFTSALDGVVVGGLTWAWIYAFAQFAVALLLATRYTASAARLDAKITEALRQSPKKG
ncbi:DUF485 domain-containing protein [Streptomyces phyllanthi]|nr:DUF485 domain-containing protein [Streptomyces phyllanthi]